MKKKNLVAIVVGSVCIGAGSCYLFRGESSPLRNYVIEKCFPWAEPGAMQAVGIGVGGSGQEGTTDLVPKSKLTTKPTTQEYNTN